MSLTDMVLMPGGDYQQICDNLRQALGTEDAITSYEAAEMIGELGSEINDTKEALSREEQAMDAIISSNVDALYTPHYCNDRVTKIRGYAFYDTKNVAIFDFPNAVSIGSYSFKNTSATEIKLPSVKTISNQAFNGCKNLTLADIGNVGIVPGSLFASCALLDTVIIRNKSAVVTMISISVFDGTPLREGGTGGRIYVPAALIDAYKTATNWSILHGYGTCEFVALEGSEYE